MIGQENYGLYNKLYQTLMTANLHVVFNHMGDNSSFAPYMKALPKMEMSSNLYWPKEILVEVDSKALIEEYKRGAGLYSQIAQQFVEFEFTQYNADEWLWAFHTVSSRVCILNNDHDQYQNDPEYETFV